MRIYNSESEEALLARSLLKDWRGEGFLSEEQYQRMEQETVCDLRRTNIFLRLVLFLFTLLIVCAGAGMFVAEGKTTGVFLLLFAAASYAGAEFAVSEARLYRYGIEEALAVCSVGFLCLGLQSTLLSGHSYSLAKGVIGSLVPATGAIFSLWIWRRFGLSYAFLAAMIFVVFVPGHWTSSQSAQHLMVVILYAAGLAGVVAVRPRHCFSYLNDGYSLVEAFLWLGIYLAINLQLSSLTQLRHWWGVPLASIEFSRPFYWTTWVLIWCLPPAILARGVRRKDRYVIAVGALTATLTLVTNKSYLDWPRHSWDPMLLGILFMGIALFIQRWLVSGPGGIRRGFTATRLSGKDKQWMNAGSLVLGQLSPQLIPPSAQAGGLDVKFGGGDSGGGGASSDF